MITALDHRVKRTAEEIEQAINGEMKFTSRLLLGKMLSKLEACDKEIKEIYSMMVNMSQKNRPQIELIDSIPSLAELSAIYIIAEIGTDLSSFKTANHLTAWAGLSPKDNESAGKLRFSKTQKANIYIKSVLTECAWAAVRTRDTRISNWYWSNVKRIGQKKAIIAVARKLLVYIYAMLKSGEMYNGSLDVADTEKRKAEKLESAQKIVEHQSYRSNMPKHSNDIEQGELKITEDISQQSIKTLEPSDIGRSIDDKSEQPKRRGRPRKTDNINNQTKSSIA